MKTILRHLNRADAILGVTFVTDAEIKRLNHRYRKKNKSTDVLSFPMGEGNLLGDVVISLDTVARQAREKKWPKRSEILFLIIHGILHLLGYDHVRLSDWRRMSKQEKRLWSVVGG